MTPRIKPPRPNSGEQYGTEQADSLPLHPTLAPQNWGGGAFQMLSDLGKADKQENRPSMPNQSGVPKKSVTLTLSPIPRSQIKSRERVREMAEVYTRDEEVWAMLDLLGDISHNIGARFLEPSAGNGNFLAAILERKLKTALAQAEGKHRRRDKVQKEFEYSAVQAFGSIYAVDIDPENVHEAQGRLRGYLEHFCSGKFNTLYMTPGFYESVHHILRHNIQQGDMLEGTAAIEFTEFSAPRQPKISQRVFRLDDLLAGGLPASGLFKARRPMPIRVIPMRNYWELADA